MMSLGTWTGGTLVVAIEKSGVSELCYLSHAFYSSSKLALLSREREYERVCFFIEEGSFELGAA